MTEDGAGLSPQAMIWHRFRPQVLQRVDTLEEAALALLEGRLDEKLRSVAEQEAHRLAGAVGTFGYDRASRLAREAEQILLGTADLPPSAVPRLSAIVLDLRAELETTYREGSAAEDDGAGTPVGRADLHGVPHVVSRFWLVCTNADRAEEISMEAHGRGHQLDAYDTVAEVMAAIETEIPPAAILIDLTEADANLLLWRDIGRLARRDPEVPVVILGDGNRFPDRLEAARQGVRAYLTLPARAATLLDALSEAAARVAGASILIVDTDQGPLDSVSEALQKAGAVVTALDDPRQFWSKLRRVKPDVVIVGADMPGIDGFELCRIVRTDPRWRAVPVVFLIEKEEGPILRRILEAGGDDYLLTPIDPVRAVRRVAACLTRLRDTQLHAGFDSLTGLPGRRLFIQGAERYLEMASRSGKPFSLVLARVGRLAETNRTRGTGAGDEVLRRIARRLETTLPDVDLLGRWSGSVFALVALGDSAERVAQQLPRLIETIDASGVPLADGTSASVSLSYGLARFPDDGKALPLIARAADTALNGRAAPAPEHSGAGVDGAAGPAPPPARRIDVLVVDDDPVLASLLGHTIRSEGHSEYWIDDGRRAIELLTGDPPRLEARLILLDVNLPGTDGYAVLRSLRDAGVLARTTVLMLTVRTTEDEIVRALRAGAADHIGKPFSLPVLMEKIRRTLAP